MDHWPEIDQVQDLLAALRPHDTSPERSERIRARWVGALEARRLADEKRQRRQALGRLGWLEPVLAFGVSALYLLMVWGQSLAMRR